MSLFDRTSQSAAAFIHDGVFQHGRYAGETLDDVARMDSAFMEWVLASSTYLALTDDHLHTVEVAMARARIASVPMPLVPSVPFIPPLPPEARLSPPPPLPPEAMLRPSPPPPLPPEAVFQPSGYEMDFDDDGDDECEARTEPLAAPAKPAFEWTPEQRTALDAINEWHEGDDSFFSLTGPAGSGKSTLIREIADYDGGTVRNAHAREHYNANHAQGAFVNVPATLTALTGKAALRLSQCTGRGAMTLHSCLYEKPQPDEKLKFTKLREPCAELIIVDEASMVTPTLFEGMKEWASQGVRFLLVGDSYQLPPVITGEEQKQYGEDYSVFGVVNGTALETVMRSVGGVLRAATEMRKTGEICRWSEDGYTYAEEKLPSERAIDDYCNDRDDHLLITWTNSARMSANLKIRERLGHEGPLPDEGEPVLIKKNGQGFLNGEIVEWGGFEVGPRLDTMSTLWMRVGKPTGNPIIDSMRPRILISFEGGNPSRGGTPFDGQLPWVENWGKYRKAIRDLDLEPTPVTWGYCLTAHSAQGSEARRVTVFLNRGEDRMSHFRKPTTLPSGEKAPFSARWLYTAATRAKSQATIIVGR